MGRIVKRPKAIQDMTRIWRHISLESNIARADDLVIAIDKAMAMLAEYPQAGKERPEIQAGIRGFPIASYMILYLPMADGIQVVRVLHSAMNLMERLH